MDDIKDTNKSVVSSGFTDKTIPLKRCFGDDPDWSTAKKKKYCPYFNKEDFLYGTFYTKRYSWMRLALHFCNDTKSAEEERKLKGLKYVKCKSKEESKDYFANNIIGLDMLSYYPTLTGDSENTMEIKRDSIHFSSHLPKEHLIYKNVGFSRGQVELEDSWLTKFFPRLVKVEELMIYEEQSGKETKPYGSDGMNGYAVNTKGYEMPDILTYWNFYLNDKTTIMKR